MGMEQHDLHLMSNVRNRNRRKLYQDSIATGLSGDGEYCESNDHCISGACNTFNKYCYAAYKTCPNSCSGNGDCIATDSRTLDIISNGLCLEQDQFCSVSCVCDLENDGSYKFYGEDCSVQSINIFMLREQRQKLCYALKLNMAIQDVNSDVVKARAVNVAELFNDMNLVSDAALNNCTEILVTTVKENADIAGEFAVANELTYALSKILTRKESLSDSLLSDVYNTLAYIAQGSQGKLAIGEAPMEFGNENFRMLVGVSDKIDLSTRTYKVPRTTYEALLDVGVPTISIADVSTDETISEGM